MKNNGRESLGFLLHDASRLIRRRFDGCAEALGLSATQWRMLLLVVRFAPISQARLAERLEVEPISVSRLIDRMQDAGWLDRVPDPNDRRSKLVQPTEKTLTAYASGRGIADGVFDEAMHGLSPDQRDALFAALAHIIRNLNEILSSEAQNEQ